MIIDSLGRRYINESQVRLTVIFAKDLSPLNRCQPFYHLYLFNIHYSVSTMRFQYLITVMLSSGAIAGPMTAANGNLVRRGGGGPNEKAQTAMQRAKQEAAWETCMDDCTKSKGDPNFVTFEVMNECRTKCAHLKKSKSGDKDSYWSKLEGQPHRLGGGKP